MARRNRFYDMISKERSEELRKIWYFECPDWTEEAYNKWYEELSEEEQGLITAWNKKYLCGLPPYCIFD